jgi:hypothetical protein
MVAPLHWLTCPRCNVHVGYVIGRTGGTRRLRWCEHMPPVRVLTVVGARELVRSGRVRLTTQERLFS